ncbi:hypothetical protein SCYAM73S_02560 [Streptomyces cyaneofuscatus]
MPKPGSLSAKSIAVSTGAFTLYSCAGLPFLVMSFQAPTMSIRPEPWACAGTSLMWLAELVSATRRSAGGSSRSFCFAAESSRAAAPAACGEAIEVPWSIE